MPLSGPEAHLYPPAAAWAAGMLPVSATHALYWEQSGSRQGVPVVHLHGGPGGGASPRQRRFFDPAFYRIVVHAQRGAGQSTPAAEIAENTTQHLVDDLERLREHLGLERWLLFGGSWGSTLALAYAQAHPHRVLGLVLRGVFLGSAREIAWFMYGMRSVFPEHWHRFAEFLPARERGDLLAGYHRRLIDPDPEVHLPAAHAWSRYESSCCTLLPSAELVARVDDDDAAALSVARLEAHYFANRVFLPEGALLEGVARIRHLPCTIVQGRYDMVCPIATADALHRAWPEAEYVVVPDAGHSAWEPGIARELVRATNRFRARLAQAA